MWAYGCTLYEIATGMPPYPKTQPGRKLGATLGRAPPRLNELDHAKELCDLVAFVLEAKPAERPSMQAVLQHPYILDSNESYPTKSLAELVKIYYRWEHMGGQRQSLFINAGAAAAEFPADVAEEEDWNFSTTANFEQEILRNSLDSSIALHSSSSNSLGSSNMQAHEDISAKGESSHILSTVNPNQSSQCQHDAGPPRNTESTPTGARTPVEQLNTEERIKRGQDALKGLFDEQQAPYVYQVKADFVEKKPISNLGPADLGKSSARPSSDLPLRDESVQSSVYRKEFDADQVRSATYDSLPNIDLSNVGTIKANKANRMNRFLDNMGHDNKNDDSFYYGNQPEEDKRATKEWTFPTEEPESVAQDPKRATIEWGFPPDMPDVQENQHLLPVPARPNLRHAVTAPVGEIERSSGMIDLDALYDDPLYDSNILRTAPGSDEDMSSRSIIRGDARITQSSVNELETPHDMGSKEPTTAIDSAMSEDELIVSHLAESEASSVVSSNSDIGYESHVDWDPFGFDNEAVLEKWEKEFDAHLDKEGVTDPLERANKRRDYLLAVRGVMASVDEGVTHDRHEEFQKRCLKGVGDFPGKYVHTWIS